ncbi:MAG: M23 family metallopeptidase [Blautia sp.]|nr:M23 family metallopeptidase [Blautia sp.]
MSKKGKIRVALGSLLALTLVVTCVAVYQSGSKSRANEKEFVKENEEDIVDQAIKTEEREETEEETQDVNTTDVEGTRDVEDSTQESTEETAPETVTPETTQEQTPAPEAENTSAQAAAVPEINFTESSLMEWPVNGQVVLDYNMDNTIYFPTLNVYKLNPAIAISSEVGSPVAAVANGKIVSVVNNEETGQTVTVDMGNGYQAVYGQLKDVPFQAEEYVSAGSVLGYISEPTKYYTKEGANLYFALSKDGVPLDPMQYLP